MINNSVFGKAMENIRNHKHMKLVTSKEKYTKYVMKPNFKDGHSFSRYLFAVEMGKTELNMNKPVYLGQAILDLSKTLMYEFRYDYTFFFIRKSFFYLSLNFLDIKMLEIRLKFS